MVVDFARRSAASEGVALSARWRRIRLCVLCLGAVLWVALLVARLSSLQITDVERWGEWALKQHLTEVSLASERGPMYDRNGKLLAVSVPAGSVYVRPGQVRRDDRERLIAEVSEVLEIPRSEIAEILKRPQPFVWVRRQIPRAAAEQVADLKIPGVGYVIEARRYYPFNRAASALIGKVGIDGSGLSGLERKFERHLHGSHVVSTARRDALGKLIHERAGDGNAQLPRGDALHLTIDSTIQMIVDEELEDGKITARAKNVMAVMADAESGEILALGQAPAANFNDPATMRSEGNGTLALRNIVVETVFEPGSILKPLVVAAAMDQGVISGTESFDCGKGRFSVGKHTIKDVHPYDVLSVRDIIVRSSNIGMSRIGFLLGRERLHAALARYGFGQGGLLGLPGETGGILRNYKHWAMIDEATHSFGQGIAVTPIQMVRAMSAIANGGVLPQMQIVHGQAREEGTRILSAAAAESAREMMYAAVEDEHGTGKRAAIAGLRVGGKTGTAQKARSGGRGYEPGAYMASFVGFVDGVPAGVSRTLTLIVIVDEPNTDSIYGGVLAAPIFQRIMERSIQQLAAEERLGARSSSGKFGLNPHDPIVRQPEVVRYQPISF